MLAEEFGKSRTLLPLGKQTQRTAGQAEGETEERMTELSGSVGHGCRKLTSTQLAGYECSDMS
jgi:hypothetical protein